MSLEASMRSKILLVHVKRPGVSVYQWYRTIKPTRDGDSDDITFILHVVCNSSHIVFDGNITPAHPCNSDPLDLHIYIY